MIFLLLVSPPLLVSLIILLFSKGKITWIEFGAHFASIVLVAIIGLYVIAYSVTADTELLNGSVTGKTSEHVSCSHSYQCNPHPVTTWVDEDIAYHLGDAHLLPIGSRSSYSSSRSSSSRNYSSRSSAKQSHRVAKTVIEYDTCYRHPYDVSWYITTSLRDTLEVDRVDSQGVIIPERWKQAYVGEPASKEHLYTNYIQANPDSVLLHFSEGSQELQKLVPEYSRVYDMYRVHHFLNVGVNVPNYNDWDQAINRINANLGEGKQVNIMMIVVGTADPSFEYALHHKWVGGKKNDAIIIVGAPQYPKIDWVRIVSWTPNKDYIVQLRDRILDIGTMDKQSEIVQAITAETATRFERMHMKKYQYLMMAYEPSTTAVLVMFLINCVISGLIQWWSWKNEFITDTFIFKRAFKRV
jgi:hypothetical protein